MLFQTKLLQGGLEVFILGMFIVLGLEQTFVMPIGDFALGVII